MATKQDTKITPEDLERKFRSLQGDVQGVVEDKKATAAGIAAGGGLLLLMIFFLLGKRAGKKRSAIVEIRRI
jgi:hypothetical protein